MTVLILTVELKPLKASPQMKSMLLGLACRILPSGLCMLSSLNFFIFFDVCTRLECPPHPLYLTVSNSSFKTLLKDHPPREVMDASRQLLTLCSALWWHLHLDACRPSGHCILIVFTFLLPLLNCAPVVPPCPLEN